MNAGCFGPPYIFGGDGASAPEVLGQDPAEYACFSQRLGFPPVGSLSPELERADLVGPATCFGPPDLAAGYLGTTSSGSPASSSLAALGGRRRSAGLSRPAGHASLSTCSRPLVPCQHVRAVQRVVDDGLVRTARYHVHNTGDRSKIQGPGRDPHGGELLKFVDGPG